MSEVNELKLFPEKKLKQITFGEIAKKYWELHGKTTKSAEKQIYIYNKVVKHFANKKVYEITTENIQSFYNNILATTSPSTANRYFSLIRAIFNKADDLGLYTGRNPCKGVSRRPDNPPRERYLTKEEIVNMIKQAPNNLSALIICAITTGMRRGEILNLDWKDINLESNTIYIHESKANKPRRIPIINTLKNVFLKLKPKKEGKIFNITKPALRYRIRKFFNSLGLEDFRLHDLRHSFASLFEAETSDNVALQEILGHSDPSLTKRYTHLGEKHITKLIYSLDGFFCKAVKSRPQTQ